MIDAPASTALLQARGLRKTLGGRSVVNGVDFQVEPGQVVGLLGANGAGKTTCLRMCYGMLSIDHGSVLINGRDLQRDPDGALRDLGVCTQDDTFDGDLNVRDNLLHMARYFRPRPTQVRERVAELLAQFELEPFAMAKPETLSGGYRRRLGIARALVHRPRVLFLDEPTTGLDPQARMAVWDLVNQLRQDGLGMVLTTHYMDEAHQLSDTLLVLQQGQVLARGAARSILGHLVGEHMVIIADADSESVATMQRWLAEQSLPAARRILHHWQFPLDDNQLLIWKIAAGSLPYQVREPTLDDVFTTLAGQEARAC